MRRWILSLFLLLPRVLYGEIFSGKVEIDLTLGYLIALPGGSEVYHAGLSSDRIPEMRKAEN